MSDISELSEAVIKYRETINDLNNDMAQLMDRYNNLLAVGRQQRQKMSTYCSQLVTRCRQVWRRLHCRPLRLHRLHPAINESVRIRATLAGRRISVAAVQPARLRHNLPSALPSAPHATLQERQRAGESAGLQERLQVGRWVWGVGCHRGGYTEGSGGASSGRVWGPGTLASLCASPCHTTDARGVGIE